MTRYEQAMATLSTCKRPEAIAKWTKIAEEMKPFHEEDQRKEREETERENRERAVQDAAHAAWVAATDVSHLIDEDGTLCVSDFLRERFVQLCEGRDVDALYYFTSSYRRYRERNLDEYDVRDFLEDQVQEFDHPAITKAWNKYEQEEEDA
jgi:hypothetical protein